MLTLFALRAGGSGITFVTLIAFVTFRASLSGVALLALRSGGACFALVTLGTLSAGVSLGTLRARIALEDPVKTQYESLFDQLVVLREIQLAAGQCQD